MSCKYCNSERERKSQDVYDFKDAKYCRMCSGPLFEPVPLTLEQLRKMDGQPVYVVIIDSSNIADAKDAINSWGLVRTSWVRIWDESRADLIHIDHHFEDYGETWLAYTHKP